MLTLMQIYVRIDILHTGITYIFTCKVPVGLIFYFNASYILKRKRKYLDLYFSAIPANVWRRVTSRLFELYVEELQFIIF